MAKRKKHDFHCQKCGTVCHIYKKGRAHRVFVCERCGVLATNPFSLGGAASGATTGAAVGSVVPGIGTGIGAAIGGALGAFGGGDKKKKTDDGERRAPRDSYSTEERVHDALM